MWVAGWGKGELREREEGVARSGKWGDGVVEMGGPTVQNRGAPQGRGRRPGRQWAGEGNAVRTHCAKDLATDLTKRPQVRTGCLYMVGGAMGSTKSVHV